MISNQEAQDRLSAVVELVEGNPAARTWWKKQKHTDKETALSVPIMKAVSGKMNVDRNKSGPEAVYGSVTGLAGIKKIVDAVSKVTGTKLIGGSKIIEPKMHDDVYLFFGSKKKPPVLMTYYYSFKGEDRIKKGSDYIYDVELFIE